MIAATQVLFFLLFHLYIVIITIIETESFRFHLFLYHVLQLAYFLFLIFIEFETTSHDITITNLTCLAFLHLGQICLTEFDEIFRRMDFSHF